MWRGIGLWACKFLVLPPCNQELPATLYYLRCFHFFHQVLPQWVEVGCGGVGSGVCSFAVLLVMVDVSLLLPYHCLCLGLAAIGASYSGRKVASAPLALKDAECGLQPNSFLATTSSGAVAGARLHLWPLSLSFPASGLPCLF